MDASDLNVLPAGKTLGTDATMEAIAVISAGSTEFRITLGNAVDVVDGDIIIAPASSIQSLAGVMATADVTFQLPDITPPKALYSNAITLDVGTANNNVYGQGDQLQLVFDEPIQVSRISGTSIAVASENSLGSAVTAVVQDPENVGFGITILVTLGSAASITESDTVSVKKGDIADSSGNEPTSDISYMLDSAAVTTIEDISIDAGLYESGDEIKVRVQFTDTVTVNLAGSTITLELDVGGSVVLAEIDTSTPSGDIVEFSYSASGVIDTDGIEVVGNSLETWRRIKH